MSDEPLAAPPAATDHPGYFQRAEQAVEHLIEHPAAMLVGAARIAPEIAAAARDHAGTVFDVAGDILAVLKVIDPQDAAAIEAAEVLVPKVLAMAESAARIGQALHHA